MVLFVDLDNAVFLVVVGAGGQETGRGGLVGFQDAGFDGRGFAAHAPEGGRFVAAFAGVGVGFVRAQACEALANWA